MQSFLKKCIYIYKSNVGLMDIDNLIERGRKGDETALRNLYEAYHERMTVVCQRIVGDWRVAEELAHDAFLLAFARLDSLRDPHRFESWLTSISTNVALRYKKRHHEPEMISLSTIKEERVFTDTASAEDKRLPSMSELMKAVDDLPDGYGRVFRLAVIEEMSHKEIADILGIAAHSSSSQLSRAKKMLQKSLAQYWVWLLPLLLPVAYILFKTNKATEECKDTATRQDVNAHQPTEQAKPSVASPDIPKKQRATATTCAVAPSEYTPIDSITVADTIPRKVMQEDAIDTIRNDKPLPYIHFNNDTHTADQRSEKPTDVKTWQPKWSVELAYTGSMDEQSHSRTYSFTETPLVDATSQTASPVSFDNWSDYAAFLSSIPVEGDFHTQQIMMKIAQNNAARPNADKIERTTHHYMPVTFSLALKYKLNSRFGLETGLSYSRLKSEFEIGTDGNAIREQQAIHYLGIPLKGTYNIYDVRRWNLYGSLGVKLEIPVYAPFSTSYFVNGMKELEEKSILHAPLQWSVGTGLGLQYNLTPNIGFFAEPSLQYYIPTGSNIETYRTEHPFTFSLPIGIRITW